MLLEAILEELQKGTRAPVEKPKGKLQLAVEWLRENPAQSSLSSRQLEKQVGLVSHALWAKAKNLIAE